MLKWRPGQKRQSLNLEGLLNIKNHQWNYWKSFKQLPCLILWIRVVNGCFSCPLTHGLDSAAPLPVKTPNEPPQLNWFIHVKCERGARGTVGNRPGLFVPQVLSLFASQSTKQHRHLIAKSFPLARVPSSISPSVSVTGPSCERTCVYSLRKVRTEWAELRQIDSEAHLHPLINA